jgi:hypothetical protein
LDDLPATFTGHKKTAGIVAGGFLEIGWSLYACALPFQPPRPGKKVYQK